MRVLSVHAVCRPKAPFRGWARPDPAVLPQDVSMLDLLRAPETLLGHVIDQGGDTVRIKHPDGRLLTLRGASGRIFALLERATQGRSLGPTLPGDADLVASLRRDGFLVPKNPPRARVSLIGSGPLAIGLALALATRARVELACLDHVPPGHPSTDEPGSQRSIRAYFDGRSLPEHVTLSQRHWADLQACDTDLTVVAGATIEADRLIGRHLTSQGIVHVFASGDRCSATVGPLVVPGVTACLNCTDLARTRVDKAWPVTLAKLSARAGGSNPGLIDWAAATLLLEIGWWLDKGASQLASTSMTVCGQQVGPGTRLWEPDPTCSCAGHLRSRLVPAA